MENESSKDVDEVANDFEELNIQVGNDKVDEKAHIEPDLENRNELTKETDTEEAGYKSDKSASEEGSTDNVVDRRRSKGSSGYEESDDGRDEEGSDVSEGHKASNDEEGEYDEEESENYSSDDVIEEYDNEGETEGYEEDKEDESKEETEDNYGNENNEDDEDADPKSPSTVPRRTGFWDHDDRYEDIQVEESRQPKGNRKLWDRTVDRWQHDMYVEEEQGPKEDWELEESRSQYEENNSRRTRKRRELGEFIVRRGRGGRGRGRGGRGREIQERSRDEQPEHPRAEREHDERRLHRDEDDRSFNKNENKRLPENIRSSKIRNENMTSENETRRGRQSHLRGQPRGRAHFRGKAKPERQQEYAREDEWGADVDYVSRDIYAQDDVQQDQSDKNDSEKVEEKERKEDKREKSPKIHKESQENRQGRKSDENKSQEKSSSVAEKKQERKEPRGRGKGIASNKTTGPRKTAKDYSREKNVHEQASHKQDKTIYEDAELDVEGDSENVKSKHQAMKPKRYSSQRQRQSAAEEPATQNLEDDPAIQNSQYYAQNSQQNYHSQPQDVILNPNLLMFIQQQMQVLQQQQQQQQQQMPTASNQGNPVLTPEIQQYMQQQYLRFQNFQNMMQQQQQQLQQQQQQQQLQQQQMQGMGVRQPNVPNNESQRPPADGGMMMQGNPYQTVPSNVHHYNMIQRPRQAIYPQNASQYEVLMDPVIQGQQAPTQQPGLYIPPVQQIPQQQQPEETPEQYGQRKLRSAAIPIKRPPEVQ